MSAPLQKGTEVIAGETPHFLEDSWRQSPPSPYESRLCRPPAHIPGVVDSRLFAPS